VLAIGMAAACGGRGGEPRDNAVVKSAGFSRAPFGQVDGKNVFLYRLINARGMEVRAMSYGATIVSLRVPDRNGQSDDVVLGFDTLDGYLAPEPYFGAVVGRYGNRIAKGQFTLDGTTYHLATNNGPNHLHGGLKGFDKVVWDAEPFDRDGRSGIVFTHVSPDGDEGYPGTLNARVTYTLTPDNDPNVQNGHFDGLKIGGQIGVGAHIYFNEWFGLQFELRDYIVGANPGGLDVNGDRKLDSKDEGAQNNIFFGVGLTFMLPPTARQSR